MLSILVNVITPVFLLAALGYWWERSGKPFDIAQITALVTLIGAPCLILDTLMSAKLDQAVLLSIGLASVLCHLGFLSIAFVATRFVKQPMSTFAPGITFGNTGNLGLPLCLFAFGDQGVALAIGYFSISSVLMFTVGPQLYVGKASFRQVVQTPMVWAVALAMGLLAAGMTLPTWLQRSVHLLAGIAIPIMLMALGVSLSRLQVSHLWRSLYFAIARIGGGFLVGWAVCELLSFHGTLRGVVLLEAAMPVAVFNYLFAVQHKNKPEEVAGMVMASTLLSILVIPIILRFSVE